MCAQIKRKEKKEKKIKMKKKKKKKTIRFFENIYFHDFMLLSIWIPNRLN